MPVLMRQTVYMTFAGPTAGSILFGSLLNLGQSPEGALDCREQGFPLTEATHGSFNFRMLARLAHLVVVRPAAPTQLPTQESRTKAVLTGSIRYLAVPGNPCKLLILLLFSLWHGRGHRFDPGQVHQLTPSDVKTYGRPSKVCLRPFGANWRQFYL